MGFHDYTILLHQFLMQSSNTRWCQLNDPLIDVIPAVLILCPCLLDQTDLSVIGVVSGDE